MRLVFAVLLISAGMSGALRAETKPKQRSVKKQGRATPETGSKKDQKWDGPDFDATKNERQPKGKR